MSKGYNKITLGAFSELNLKVQRKTGGANLNGGVSYI